MMNIKEARAYGRSQLAISPSPDLDARLLLEHVLQVQHSFLVAHDDQLLSGDQDEQYRTLVERARRLEPIPYLTGNAPFFGMQFHVSPAVLIPRPETEQLVEMVIGWARQRRSLNIVDVGTGSGCIAITLAAQLPNAHVDAVDISLPALKIARQNEQRLSPGRVHFHHGHLLSPLSHRPDVIVANLPYITDAEWTMLDDGVKLNEPAVALKGGEDGLDLVRQLLQQALSILNPGGAIFLEIGWQQGAMTQQLGQAFFPSAQIELMLDFAGHDRIVAIKTG